MLLAGDEFANSQQGNNNAYAQDNDISWLDWGGLDSDPDFLFQVQNLIRMRRELDWSSSEWLNPDGGQMTDDQWHNDRTMMLLLPGMEALPDTQGTAVVLMFNSADDAQYFTLPGFGSGTWELVFHSMGSATLQTGSLALQLDSRSIACAVYTGIIPADSIPPEAGK
jgi:isoamylase